MKRSTFVGEVLAGISFPSVTSSGLSPIVSKIKNIERWSTGKIAVVAQRFDDVLPFFAYREKTVVPAASTIKLLILMTLFKQADSDVGLLRRKIVISAGDIVGGSEIYDRAEPGARYEIDNLAHSMIAQSDNTASNALIDLLGFARINTTASVLGLTATRLGRMFSSSPQPRRIALNHTCAGDLAALVLNMTHGARNGRSAIVSQAGCRQMLAFLSDQEDHTKIGRGLPRNTRLANKTGEVSHVRNDVGIVNQGKPDEYVLAVMAFDLDADGRGDEAVAKVTRVIDPLIRAPRTSSVWKRLFAD